MHSKWNTSDLLCSWPPVILFKTKFSSIITLCIWHSHLVILLRCEMVHDQPSGHPTRAKMINICFFNVVGTVRTLPYFGMLATQRVKLSPTSQTWHQHLPFLTDVSLKSESKWTEFWQISKQGRNCSNSKEMVDEAILPMLNFNVSLDWISEHFFVKFYIDVGDIYQRFCYQNPRKYIRWRFFQIAFRRDLLLVTV